jgi:hypothetical protein
MAEGIKLELPECKECKKAHPNWLAKLLGMGCTKMSVAVVTEILDDDDQIITLSTNVKVCPKKPTVYPRVEIGRGGVLIDNNSQAQYVSV